MSENIMQMIATSLDKTLNPDGGREIGFGVLVFDTNQPLGGRTNWVSNCNRADMLVAMKEIIARWEGQPHVKGRD